MSVATTNNRMMVMTPEPFRNIEVILADNVASLAASSISKQASDVAYWVHRGHWPVRELNGPVANGTFRPMGRCLRYGLRNNSAAWRTIIQL
jgi:hypothetical protein